VVVKVLLCDFLASALDGSEWSALQPGPWRENCQYPLDIRLSGPQNQSDLRFFLNFVIDTQPGYIDLVINLGTSKVSVDGKQHVVAF